MDISKLEPYLRYITNASGDKTEVVVPIDVWNMMINLLPKIDNGLDAIDEYESKDSILSDLQESIRQVAAGQSYPVSELWENIDSQS